jgi:carboxyl-terminal processing protease
VLVSRFSASASEIFAGAIQDYQRGLIVGDHSTHGKGTVQTLRDLGRELFLPINAPRLGALKITMQKFYRPSGDSTQNRGVLADVELPSLTSHLPNIGEADLDYAMSFDRVDRVPFNRLKVVNDTMVAELSKNSAQRRQQSEDFQRLLEAIDRYEARKQRKAITLNEEKFMAERAAVDAEKDEEEKVTSANNGTRPVVDPDDFHLAETLAITADYVGMLSGGVSQPGQPGAPALSIDRR